MNNSSRRQFLKSTAAGLAVSAPMLQAARLLADDKEDTKQAGKKKAGEDDKPISPETLVAKLYKSLTDKQKEAMSFPFNHPLRQEVNNNWRITKTAIAKDFEKDQQEMIREIFTQLHAPQHAKKVMEQVEHDNKGRGGFGGCSVAMFGEPGKKFEFVLTGRHVTRRCDGDSVEGAAFGGPIFYGHAAKGFNEEPDHPGNIYWAQALKANELFKSLNEEQRKLALRDDARPERKKQTVALQGEKGMLHGAPVGGMTDDQKELVRAVMTDVLAPFRKADVDESMKLVEKQGFDKLHFAFYKNLDIGEDKVWDVWQIEGPSLVWYFRGHPHVHTWVHIRESA